jgi:hypothetical protein
LRLMSAPYADLGPNPCESESGVEGAQSSLALGIRQSHLPRRDRSRESKRCKRFVVQV